MNPRTLYQVLAETARLYGDAPALRQPAPDGSYTVYSWNQYRRAAEEIAAGLRALGIAKGDVVALNSETRLEFYLADLGILANGSIAAAMYPSYPAADLVRTIQTSGARAVFVEDAKTLEPLRGAPAGHWILLTGEAEGAITLEALRGLGRDALARDPELLARMLAGVSPSDNAILYLTSGATGEPKMSLVTHAALLANLEMGPKVLELGPRDSTVAFLPSAHIMQRVVIELLTLACGVQVWFSESLHRLPHELAGLKPTLFVAPPRLWERVHTSIRAELRRRSPLVRGIVEAALELGLEAVRLRSSGRRLALWKRPLLKLADRLLFRRMRVRFGGRLRVCASGSAPLGKELNEFFLAIGLPLIEGYGLTEGGIVIINRPASPRAGSIGLPMPGVEVRLAEDGEMLIRSATLFAGYYNDPQATAQVLCDGWLATGDLAEIDANGYLSIKGRKKEMIVSSSGKKIFPARIESLFHLEPIVSQIVLMGDGQPHVTALITVASGIAEGLEGPEAVAREVQEAVARVNRHLAPFEQIRKFRILDRDFSIESGELTATHKVRRARVLENFRDAVAELYR